MNVCVYISDSLKKTASSFQPHLSGQFIINPLPNLGHFRGDSLTKPPFGVTSAEVVINCLKY